MPHFTLDSFLKQLKHAAKLNKPVKQVSQVMQQAFTDHIDTVTAVFRQLDDDVMLYKDATITILH